MRHSLLTVPVTLGVLAGSSMSAVIVVDQGGGGDWMTITEAVAAASSGDSDRATAIICMRNGYGPTGDQYCRSA